MRSRSGSLPKSEYYPYPPHHLEIGTGYKQFPQKFLPYFEICA